jgi:hypothetical protein
MDIKATENDTPKAGTTNAYVGKIDEENFFRARFEFPHMLKVNFYSNTTEKSDIGNL